MSDYGSDSDPNVVTGWDLAETKKLLPVENKNMMQWTYLGRTVVKIASKWGKSNLLLKLDTS
jgi:hypothetical protein